jgi:hypothetical protein
MVPAPDVTAGYILSSIKKRGNARSARKNIQREGTGIVANVTITICPPSPQLEKFDQFQFADSGRRRNRTVTAKSQIDWSDSERMGNVASHVPKRPARWIPAFASNMEQLRAVILEHEKRNIFTYRDCTSHEAREHQRNVARAGGYRAFLAGIAYRAWLERVDCIGIAELMDIKPITVRQILFKLNQTARALGFETFPKMKQRSAAHPRLRLERRRCTIRRRLYGKPEYIEGFHCWECRIRLIDKSRNKWRCVPCLEKVKWARKRAARAA